MSAPAASGVASLLSGGSSREDFVSQLRFDLMTRRVHFLLAKAVVII